MGKDNGNIDFCLINLQGATSSPGKQLYNLSALSREAQSYEQKASTMDSIQDFFLWIPEFIYSPDTVQQQSFHQLVEIDL